MIDLIKAWLDALPGQARVLLAIAVSAILLGAGVYDNREEVQKNRESITDVKDSLRMLNQNLRDLTHDTGDIICLLLRAETDDPLVCVEERRFNDLIRDRRK